MKETQYKELKHEAEKLKDIIMDAVVANDCFQYLAQVHFGPDSLLMLKNSFLMYSYIYQFRLTAIEIHKLLGNSSKDLFNIQRFLQKLKQGGSYEMLQVESSLISRWECEIKQHKKYISHIKELRNKNFAHSDRTSIVNMASVQETNEVVNLLLNIITRVYQMVNKTDKPLEHFIYSIGLPAENLRDLIAHLLDKEKHLKAVTP